jgi:histidinol-phosphate aminotransferase
MTKIHAHHYLETIETYKPGRAAIVGSKAKIIKLSSNENALGASPKALTAYTKHGEEIFRYAEGSCKSLRNALAQKNNINAERIVCGAGSDEIIALLTQAFAGRGDEIIYSAHGFLMYPISAKRVGAMPIAVSERNLKTDVDAILAAITAKTKIIFIANPNNPAGSYLNKLEIQKLIDGTPKNILIVLDHAYQEFVVTEDYPDAIDFVNKNDNVVVTRTFSKIYGLASLRIGWCYSSQYIVDILNKIRGPFNVGGPAQAAAIAALEDDEFFALSKNHNQKWLEIFFDEIPKYNKIKAYPSIANFILLDFGNAELCKKANEILLLSNIILREMRAYSLPNCLRMTIGIEAENIKLLEILKQIDGI